MYYITHVYVIQYNFDDGLNNLNWGKFVLLRWKTLEEAEEILVETSASYIVWMGYTCKKGFDHYWRRFETTNCFKSTTLLSEPNISMTFHNLPE